MTESGKSVNERNGKKNEGRRPSLSRLRAGKGGAKDDSKTAPASHRPGQAAGSHKIGECRVLTPLAEQCPGRGARRGSQDRLPPRRRQASGPAGCQGRGPGGDEGSGARLRREGAALLRRSRRRRRRWPRPRPPKPQPPRRRLPRPPSRLPPDRRRPRRRLPARRRLRRRPPRTPRRRRARFKGAPQERNRRTRRKAEGRRGRPGGGGASPRARRVSLELNKAKKAHTTKARWTSTCGTSAPIR